MKILLYIIDNASNEWSVQFGLNIQIDLYSWSLWIPMAVTMTQGSKNIKQTLQILTAAG